MNLIITMLKRINDWVAIIAGIALLAGVGLICAEILMRAMGVHFTGSDEISGYLMASISSWGISYALLNRAHVRIDILRDKTSKSFRCVFDLIAIASVSFVAIYVATKVVSVIDKSLRSGALANTALETPLIIPQSIWFAGWIWFAISSTLLFLVGLSLFFTRRFDQVDRVIGTESEV
ncbi:TRAP transporter small permease [Vibrio sp.]|uniref:TRAP transporter small permease protein n=1 Tax=Vibrio viridaestus TaxID=2487322 RepID=A0A3N9TFF2_9VIBR|nr:TRAP transporter small permease [Vibrio viridaestus]MDC0610821.1 TRAP transporter small permease [Vibrio sp.]RQW62604.1 TRAP transporter small permease subunit [Vibrio viridaestus]